MTRDVFLIVYRSPVFPAHWALWIPSVDNTNVGKIINVIGDASSGFEHEFVRNHDLEEESHRRNDLVLLAKVNEEHIVDSLEDGSNVNDATAVDDIERKALEIPAPVKSLRLSTDPPTKRVEIQNCQTWLRELVVGLVAAEIFPESSIVAMDNAPKN
ncbi:hypothetical protein BD410DRAFT_893314 [Rickenella mellea]|uniref:Uncharacterized protein n=1 Tax=Rickenella mellea TaxID=50990 RepID=A0A4R5XG81_9AGAM|nr:hypothetical protein BD410DRAFT_893314 [Rickenella mellea]